MDKMSWIEDNWKDGMAVVDAKKTVEDVMLDYRCVHQSAPSNNLAQQASTSTIHLVASQAAISQGSVLSKLRGIANNLK
ncbi:hypothetical protein FRB93_000487 [Tulasnella sp. JGI-2019a]|nr:hypothetical protein FRB93_000487 [Tulasnella sp. JGI-2019a]